MNDHSDSIKIHNTININNDIYGNILSIIKQ